MKSMIENFINGNLTDAKKQAKKYSLTRIYNALTDDYGYSRERGLVIAKYLKGRASFEEACDAV